jgi:hypothetical protein
MDAPMKNTHENCKRIFNDLLDRGVDPDEIISAAKAYAMEVSSSGISPLPFVTWLETRAWERYRH